MSEEKIVCPECGSRDINVISENFYLFGDKDPIKLIKYCECRKCGNLFVPSTEKAVMDFVREIRRQLKDK